MWSVFIPNHHEGFIDMATYEANRARITANTHPRPHQPSGGAVREGSALLQGVVVCEHWGRKLRTHYTGTLPPAITVPARPSQMVVVSTASASAQCKSTRQSYKPLLLRGTTRYRGFARRGRAA